MQLDLEIENVYEDQVVMTFVTVQVPPPPLPGGQRDHGAGREADAWANRYIFPATGTNRDDAADYHVTVVGSSDPDLIGLEFEFWESAAA